MASLLALIVDAITDPMVGQLSDRYKSRWGRRHPFMLIVCLDARLRDHCADLFDLLLRAAFVARRRNGA
jgi:hypothetical protein